MQIVTYDQCLKLWADLVEKDNATGLLTADKDKFNRAFNRVIRRGWEWQWWPDLMLCEERWFRARYRDTSSYAAPTYNTPQEVFFSGTRKYYQSIKAVSSGSTHWPALLSAGAYTLNSDDWAECAFSYSGSDWAASTAYAKGTIVRRLVTTATGIEYDGRYYVCHTAHTSSSSFDDTKFGVLTNFVPYVAWDQSGATALGTVRECYQDNPRTTANVAKRRRWEADELGIRCIEDQVPESIWIDFRKRCPRWFGADFSASATYASGVTRYYSSSTDGYEGDFWTTNASTSAAQSPETTASKWDKIPIPAFLMDFAAHGAKVAYLEGDGQLEKALADSGSELWSHLYDEADKLMASAQNRPRRSRLANV